VIPDASRVDFVLDDLEAFHAEDDAGADSGRPRSDAVWIDYESHAARGSRRDDDIEDLDTLPEPLLDDDITLVRARPVERTWWEAARRGLRAIRGD
jgi:hypothetical protein